MSETFKMVKTYLKILYSECNSSEYFEKRINISKNIGFCLVDLIKSVKNLDNSCSEHFDYSIQKGFISVSYKGTLLKYFKIYG